MFSKRHKSQGASAAWRIAIWPTAAFAVGSALAFLIMYLLIARDIQKRSDAWLSGEAETLNDVSGNTTRDALYDRLVGEVAELASREVVGADDSSGDHPTSVFFLETTPGEIDPIWVGPGPREPFIAALKGAQLAAGIPASVQVEGWNKAFRVVYKRGGDGGALYLGFADLSGAQMLDRLTERCVLVWAVTVVLGFLITWIVAFHTLSRVDRISDTVARMGSDDLSSRLPEGQHPDEITRLSRTFNHMLGRIQASVNQMRILTDSVAHDLKSPVTSIRGSLEVALSDGTHGPWRDRVAEAIDGLDRLSRLLNTSLDVAEADAGALQLRKETIDLAELVHQLVDLYHPVMSEHRHEVVTDLQTAMVEADTGLLHRLIANLLDNEVAHLPPGCTIQVGVHQTNREAELVVSDNGPGFPAALRERAFDRFVKGEHSTGHGLGLAFVAAAVEAHGGNAEVKEAVGGGAEIVLRLPLAEVFSKKV
jgi:signal transduction histidine kinase